MTLWTERERVRTVAARWHEQYPHDNATWRALVALLDTATPADVAAIIGNNSWCGSDKCSECGEYVVECIEAGEPMDYESATVYLCLPCARKVGELAGLGTKGE